MTRHLASNPDDSISPRSQGAGTYYGNSWALVIGIGDYAVEQGPLPNARRDAEAIADALKNLHGFNVTPLLDTSATRTAITEWLQDNLPKQVKENDRVVIFFAGHGQTRPDARGGKRGYLIPYTSAKPGFADYVDMEDLHRACRLIPAKHIFVILDCCFSGIAAMGTRAKPPVQPELLDDGYVRQLTSRSAWQILTASATDELAADSGIHPGHSVFTSALLAALAGLADHNNDGVMTASDIASYVKPRVSRETSHTGGTGQTPFFTYMLGSEQGDAVFITPTQLVSKDQKEQRLSKNIQVDSLEDGLRKQDKPSRWQRRTTLPPQDLLRSIVEESEQLSQTKKRSDSASIIVLGEQIIRQAVVYNQFSDRIRAVHDQQRCQLSTMMNEVRYQLVEAYEQRAEHFTQNRDYNQSIAHFRRAIELDPHNELLYLLISINHHQIGDNTGAEKNVSWTNGLDVVHHFIYTSDTKVYDYSAPITYYTAKIVETKQPALEYYARSVCHRLNNQLDEAMQDITRAIEHQEHQSVYYFTRGVCYERKNLLDEALTDYTEAIRFESNSASYHHTRATCYEQKGDFLKALADYNRAIELHPKNHQYMYGRGKYYYNRGDYQRSLQNFTRAIELTPPTGLFTYINNCKQLWPNTQPVGTFSFSLSGNDDFTNFSLGVYHFMRGLCHQSLQKNEAAIRDYTWALDLGCREHFIFQNRAIIYVKTHEFDKAIRDYSSAIRLNPQADYFWRRGRIRYMQFLANKTVDHDLVLADYTNAINGDPDNPNYYFSRAELFKSIKRYHEAMADYTSTIELDPNNAEYYYELGLLQLKGDSLEQAKRNLGLARERGHPRARIALVKAGLIGIWRQLCGK